jgi:Transposase DDE domain
VRLDLLGGGLHGPTLQDGRTHDQRAAPTAADLTAGALLLTDLGYFCLDTLAAYSRAAIAWLTRLKVNTILTDASGARGTVADLVARQPGHVADLDVPVQVGARHHLAARLVAARVPTAVAAQRRRALRAAAQREGQTPSAARLAVADWTVYVTNVPPEQLTLPEALVLARARWQIELLFKRWKSLGQVAAWRSQQPWRILCEVYAKLLGQVLSHWLTLLGVWHRPEHSLWLATRAVQQQALHLASVFDQPDRLHAALTLLAFELAVACRMNPRKTHPNTYQLLLDHTRPA